MSATTSRPPIPRPTARKPVEPSPWSKPDGAPSGTAPAVSAREASALPPASTGAAPAPVSTSAKSASITPSALAPMMMMSAVPVSADHDDHEGTRERSTAPDLAEDELVEADVIDVAPARAATPPPPPPLRSSHAPTAPPPPSLRSTHAPTAPPPSITMPPSYVESKIEALPLPPSMRGARLAAPAPSFPAPLESHVQVRRAASSEPGARVESALDPTDLLFDGMYALEFADNAWQAAGHCAVALGRALGARAVIVYGHDLARRELRAIGAHGADAEMVLGSAENSDADLVASAVLCNERPVTMRFDGELPRLAPKRFELLGAPRTLVAIPAMAWGRCVAVIEIIDADPRFSDRVTDSGAYVAERLAAYLSGRIAA